MHCFMCRSRSSAYGLQMFQDDDTFKRIRFILPKLAVPKSKDRALICTACLGQVSLFYSIKNTSLQNCVRLKYFNAILKGANNIKSNELKIILNNNEISTNHNQNNMEFKDNMNNEYLSIKDENTIYIKEEKEEYDENVGSYEFVDMNKFTEKDSNLSDSEEPKQTSNKKSLLKCDDCNKTFTYPSRLQNHRRIHTKERPFKCELCEKTFTTPSNLNTHTLVHSGTKSHECSICHKTFRYKTNLRVHERSHTNERPHQCGMCSKAFKQTGDLVRHKLTHTGQKPHQCQICKFKCTQAAHLKRHMMTHTAKKVLNSSVLEKTN